MKTGRFRIMLAAMASVLVTGVAMAGSFKDSRGNTYYYSLEHEIEGRTYILTSRSPRTGSDVTSVDLAEMDDEIRNALGKIVGNNGFFYYLRDDFVANSFTLSAVTKVTVPNDSYSVMSDSSILCEFTGCTAYAVRRVLDDDEPEALQVYDGVLYQRGGGDGYGTLYAYPAGRTATSYTVKDTVWKIDYHAFCNAKKLTTVVLPKSCDSIDVGAFYGSGLRTLTVNAEALDGIYGESLYGTPWWDSFGSGKPVVLKGWFLGISGTCPTTVSVPSTARGIAGMVAGVDAMKTLRLPSSVKIIGYEAFAGCSNLTKVEFSEGLERIANGAFADSGLTTFTIPRSMKNLNGGAFEDCAWWKSNASKQQIVKDGWLLHLRYDCPENVTIGEGVRTIAEYAIGWCEARNITFPASLKSFSGYSVVSCDYLTNMTFKGDCPKVLSDWDKSDIGLGCFPEVTIQIQPKADGWIMDNEGKVFYCQVLQPAGTGTLRIRNFYGEDVTRQYMYPGKVYGLPRPPGWPSAIKLVEKTKGRMYDNGTLVWNLVAAGSTAYLDQVDY